MLKSVPVVDETHTKHSMCVSIYSIILDNICCTFILILHSITCIIFPIKLQLYTVTLQWIEPGML